MVRRTHRTRKQRAGGLGNTLRRAFGFKPKQVAPGPAPVQVQAQAGPGQAQPPWYKRIFQRTRKAPAPAQSFETNTNFRPHNQNLLYTWLRPGTEKAFAYLYQRLQNPRGELDMAKVSLTPEEHSVLRQRFLQAIYNPETQRFNMTKSINQIVEEIYGRPYDEISEEFHAWDPAQHRLDRFLNFLLRTDTEMKYFYDASAKCNVDDLEAQSNTIRTFRDTGCVTISASMAKLLFVEPSESATPLFLILQPSFIHPIYSSRYNSAYLREHVNANIARLTIPLQRIPKASFIKDAFANKGMKCIHPILGYMFQKQLPQVWTQHYFADYSFVNAKRYFKSKELEDAIRIVTLTLQKYVAIRRYAITKNHALTSQVYEVDPRTIGGELRSIDQPLLSYSVLPTRPSRPFGTPAIAYEVYIDDINEEIQENQRWALGKVIIKSLQDKQLNAYYPLPRGAVQFSWLQQQRNREPYEFLESVPEEVSARAEVERIGAMPPLEPGVAIPFGEEEAEAEALAEAEEAVPGQGENVRRIQRNLQALVEAPHAPTVTRRNNRSWIRRNGSARPTLANQLHSDPVVARYHRQIQVLRNQPPSNQRNRTISNLRRRQQNRMNEIRRNLGV